MYVPRGEKPSSKTLGVGSVVTMCPAEASMTETLHGDVSELSSFESGEEVLFG
jgi:hypothetical protein|tara:strand:- start:4158 stop:4316 length:159 start_codon:yes stop_codon:yes gene_type:complete